jgi:tRNA A37 threonylcarbamoyladenosine dehydratase
MEHTANNPGADRIVSERRQSQQWQERTALLLGEEALLRLREAVVVVAGLGGVGAYAAEMVARAGVGRMVLIDSDRVGESNKNRQLLALDSTLGRLKTEVMAERLLDINPELHIVKVPEYLTEDNIPEVFENALREMALCGSSDPDGALTDEPAASTGLAPDFVIDAIDTLAPKIALISHCVHSGIPLVSSMGAGAKLDATKVRLTDISKSYNCPLAFILRKKLRKIGITKGFPVVFSEELPEREAIVPTEGERNKKSQVGTVSYIPAVFGCVCAQAAIRHLAGR